MTQECAPLLAALREPEARYAVHAHPELGFAETRTSKLVAEQLAQWNYEVTTSIGGTGVVGRLKRGTSARATGLRADMDALPIQEPPACPTPAPWRTAMHACGHDGHTARPAAFTRWPRVVPRRKMMAGVAARPWAAQGPPRLPPSRA